MRRSVQSTTKMGSGPLSNSERYLPSDSCNRLRYSRMDQTMLRNESASWITSSPPRLR